MGIVGMILAVFFMVSAASRDLFAGVLCPSPVLSLDCMSSVLEAGNCASLLGSFNLAFGGERRARFVGKV